MKIFSKDKYIREIGMYDDRTYFQYGNWVDECDGKAVNYGYCGDYQISDRWCIDVPEAVNCKCAVKSTPARYKITIECDGTTTNARMEINGKQVKTAHAKRNPADKFNWRIGAETALGRLFEKKCKKKDEKKERPFKVGDRVVCVNSAYGNTDTNGKHGKVVYGDFSCESNIAVEFDKPIERGHSCSERHKDGHCWYCPPGDLRHE